MDCPKFWISKNVQFRHMCGAFRFWSNFGWPKIWGNPCWSPSCIALACYSWLILVINCNNEVCSYSNNTVLKAFWQKKVLPKQRISCCGVIYNLWKDDVHGMYKECDSSQFMNDINLKAYQLLVIFSLAIFMPFLFIFTQMS